MNITTNWLRIGLFSLGLSIVPSAFAADDSATTTLGVNVAAEATIAVTANPTLSKGTSEFESYLGNTTFTYRVRTTESTGSGTVTAMVTTAFDVDSGITTADLSHVASTSGVGTANSSSTVASDVTATNILGFGAGVHSSDTNDSANIAWTLVDRPAYKTGAYSTVVTLTISAS